MEKLTYFQAVVIGLLQGVTELFPISSLGHSVLVPALLGWDQLVRGETSSESFYLAFVVGLHVATAIALLVGVATASDYGITIDEFNTEDYGRKALAWYTSGFGDRSSFETVEPLLWYYGPWFQMLIAWVQSWATADPLTMRHALTFVAGLCGLAALLPLGVLTYGAWAGTAALILCLNVVLLVETIGVPLPAIR